MSLDPTCVWCGQPAEPGVVDLHSRKDLPMLGGYGHLCPACHQVNERLWTRAVTE